MRAPLAPLNDAAAFISQNQPRPPPGELTEAALEHFILPRFAMTSGSWLK